MAATPWESMTWEERQREAGERFLAMKRRYAQAEEGDGECSYCGTPIQIGRWCSANCRRADESDRG